MANTKITSRVIANDAVLTANIADDAVTSAKLDTNIAIAGTLGVTGAVTADAGVSIDNITIDGTEIDLSSGNLTLDSAGDIYLDADGADIVFLDGGTHMGTLKMANSNLNLDSQVADKDIIFSGNDGGSAVTPLTLDMSVGGQVQITNPTNHPMTIESTSDNGGYIQYSLGHQGALIGYMGSSNQLLSSGSNTDWCLRAQNNLEISVGTTQYFKVSAGDVAVKNADLKMEDSRSIYLGNGNDMRIFHDGSWNKITTTSGGFNFHNGYLAQPSTGEGFVYITNTSSITVGVSTTSSANAMSFRNGNGEKGIININGNTVAFTNLSDYREKENVDYSFDATSRLKQLKPCRFNWISDSTNTLQDGFLAHEVSSICPEAVVGEKDGVYTADDVAQEPHLVEGEAKNQMLDASKLIPLMVKTIQELEARIKTLEES